MYNTSVSSDDAPFTNGRVNISMILEYNVAIDDCAQLDLPSLIDTALDSLRTFFAEVAMERYNTTSSFCTEGCNNLIASVNYQCRNRVKRALEHTIAVTFMFANSR